MNERGEVLIAQRPVGKIAAGKWEFPGGKIEAGEAPRDALARELREELGIHVEQARPLIRVRHAYSDRIVILDTWQVSRWRGELHPHDGQEFAWVRPADLDRHDLLAADKPIVSALRLPADYVFTPPDATLQQIVRGLPGLPRGALVRLRLPQQRDAEYRDLAREILPEARVHGLQMVLDRDPGMAVAGGAAGWHAAGARLRAPEASAARDAPIWSIASCHDAEDLRLAAERGFQAAVLGPVKATRTHPRAQPLGWPRFAALAGEAGLPVYAIGGLGPQDRNDAFAHCAQGIAGISAYWR